MQRMIHLRKGYLFAYPYRGYSQDSPSLTLAGRMHFTLGLRGDRYVVAFAVVGDQDFEHVHHASLLMVCCSFQSPLERGCNPQIEAIAFDVVKFHDATQLPVQLT